MFKASLHLLQANSATSAPNPMLTKSVESVRGVGLSIRQPWVELILLGRKTIEVRSWTTKHRGELWLHAGKAVDSKACVATGTTASGLCRGALVGVAHMAGCFEFDRASWARHRAAHLNYIDFRPGLFGWLLEDARRIEPVPYPGKLGLMKIDLEKTGAAHEES